MPAAFKSHPHGPFPPCPLSVPVTPVREKVQIHQSAHLQNGKELLSSCNKASQQLTQNHPTSPPARPAPPPWTALLTLHPATIDAPQCIYIFFLFTQGYLFIYLFSYLLLFSCG